MTKQDNFINSGILWLWQEYGITYRPIVAIVVVMAMNENLSLADALKWWAEWEAKDKSFAWPASRWRSEICYRLLKVGQEPPGGLAAWFEARAKEVRDIANRVYS
jgi:hypothetical protein